MQPALPLRRDRSTRARARDRLMCSQPIQPRPPSAEKERRIQRHGTVIYLNNNTAQTNALAACAALLSMSHVACVPHPNPVARHQTCSQSLQLPPRTKLRDAAKPYTPSALVVPSSCPSGALHVRVRFDCMLLATGRSGLVYDLDI